MKVNRIPHGAATVLEVSGKVMSNYDLDILKEEVRTVIDAGSPHVVLDLAGVPWVNSTGLGILITIHHSLKAADGTLRICGLSERVLSIFQVSRLERVFDVYPDRDKALAGRP
jgi:anti-sigma B factor antagonist